MDAQNRQYCPHFRDEHCCYRSPDLQGLIAKGLVSLNTFCDGSTVSIQFVIEGNSIPEQHGISCSKAIFVMLHFITPDNKMHLLTHEDGFIRETAKKILETMDEETLQNNAANVLSMGTRESLMKLYGSTGVSPSDLFLHFLAAAI
jgi:hypothetical protein